MLLEFQWELLDLHYRSIPVQNALLCYFQLFISLLSVILLTGAAVFKSNHVLSTSHKLIMSCWLCNISSKSIFKTISFKCERCTGEIFTIIVFICISIIDICSIIFFITQFRIFRYILTITLLAFTPIYWLESISFNVTLDFNDTLVVVPAL